MPRASFKGVAIRGVLGAAERQLGGEVVRRAIGELAGEAERYRREPILAGSWYDVAVYVEVHAALRRVSGRGHALARELGYGALRADMTGTYEWLVRKLSAKQLAAWGPRLLQIYCRGVHFDVIEERSHSRRVHFTIVGADRAVWLDLAGGLEALLDLVGAQSPRVRVELAGGDVADEADIEMFWAP